MLPFITNLEFLDRFDWRWIAMQITEATSGAALAATYAQLIDTSSTAGARLQTLITDAAEELMSAAAVGARYSEADLRTYGGNLVKNINAGLAVGPILERRNRAVTDWEKISASYTKAKERVEELRRGERIFFAVPDVPEAGLPASADMTPGPLDCPTISSQAGRYFGTPATGGCGPNSGSCNTGGGCW